MKKDSSRVLFDGLLVANRQSIVLHCNSGSYAGWGVARVERGGVQFLLSGFPPILLSTVHVSICVGGCVWQRSQQEMMADVKK